MTSPPAIGYLRPHISGLQLEWHRTQMRRLATRLGYDLIRILAFGPDIDQPIHRLCVAAGRTRAEAVFVPSAAHFDGSRVPVELVQVADVITVDDVHTYARHSTGQLPQFNGA
ncbi:MULTISPECIES: hypothetical protein [unclassified Nocardia]|uniref:hypothetical protein n=1 Tax=unclassified Nocardia TaxID=2637762 RepID=UPI00278C676C|nr:MULTISPECIES: hypothetical protein [unclassified Nocardia]